MPLYLSTVRLSINTGDVIDLAVNDFFFANTPTFDGENRLGEFELNWNTKVSIAEVKYLITCYKLHKFLFLKFNCLFD